MPHIAITMFPGRDATVKMQLAQKVQALFVTELGLDPKVVSVSIEDIPVEDWPRSMEKFSSDILFVKPGNAAD